MRTPAQAFRDAIKSGAVEAWNRGEKIQHREERAIAWDMWDGKEDHTPSFSSPAWIWRPAPAKRRILFTQLTIPKGALWNVRNQKWETILEYSSTHVRFSGGEDMCYENIAENADYSTDGGATWQPGSLEMES